jgi:outer membrane protein
MTGRMRAAVAAALLLTAFAPAQALAQKIAVMDSDRVLNESAVGQHIKSELETIAATMQEELRAEGEPVQGELEAFQAETASLTREALNERPDLVEKSKDLQTKLVRLSYSEQIKARELVATKAQALAPVRAKLDEVLQALVDSENIDILVERELLIYTSEAVDITQRVIDDLNAAISTTPVERVRAPEPEEGAAAADAE